MLIDGLWLLGRCWKDVVKRTTETTADLKKKHAIHQVPLDQLVGRIFQVKEPTRGRAMRREGGEGGGVSC